MFDWFFCGASFDKIREMKFVIVLLTRYGSFDEQDAIVREIIIFKPLEGISELYPFNLLDPGSALF